MLKIKYRSMKRGRRTIDSLLSHNGVRIEVSTGVTLPPDVEFTPPRTFTGGHHDVRASLEQKLFDWENSIRNRYNSLAALHGPFFSSDIFKTGIRVTLSDMRGDDVVDQRSTLSAFLGQYRNRLSSGIATRSNGKTYSERSIILYGYVIDCMMEYILKRGDFDFGRFNLDSESAIGKSVVVRAYDDFFEGYKSFLMKDKNLGSYTVADSVTKMKFIIKDRCEACGINITDRYLAKLKYYVSGEKMVVALSQDQFEWILSNEEMIRRDNRHSSTCLQAIDFMIAGLLTAARIGDLTSITTNNLIKTEGGYLLSFIPNKTKSSSGVKVEVPIPNRLANIFLSNAERFGGRLLTKGNMPISNISQSVRRVLRRYDIFQNMVQVQDSHGNIIVKPFWMAFKFHSTRASLITYLLSKGEQETVIKSISGHTADSKSFRAYTNITNTMKQRTMQRLALIGLD